MNVVYGFENFRRSAARSVLTVGNFDGVHRAHQQLLAQAGLFAANTGGPVVVLTFEPHPLTVVAPPKAPARLTASGEKIRLLAEAGAQTIVVARSEPGLLGMEAEQFVRDVLIDRFRPTHIVEGPSFGFGRGRRGTPQLLAQVAANHDCEVHIVGPVTVQVDEGETLLVSSSLIRGLLRDGRVRQAALCLGRPFTLIGKIVEGTGRGRGLGVPTANVDCPEQLIPGDGVYAGVVEAGEVTHAAAVSVGRTPTFGGENRQIEAHVLDFEGDLYGCEIRVGFVRRLRDQRRFESAEALVEQIRRDIEAVRSEESDCANRRGRP